MLSAHSPLILMTVYSVDKNAKLAIMLCYCCGYYTANIV